MRICDSIAKMIPNDLGMTLDKALEGQSGSEERCIMRMSEVKYLIDMSKRLEGLPRHTSMHAAGVVIGSRSIDEFVPLSQGGRRHHYHPVYHDHASRNWGFLKMDFLGLRTLTVIQNAVRLAEKDYGI